MGSGGREGTGSWAAGDISGSGSGMGGPGRGRGGKAPFSDVDAKFRSTRAHAKPSGRGVITGSLFVKGQGEKGEAATAMGEALSEFQKETETALEDPEIPVARRALVRDYFDRIREPAGAAPPPAEPAPAKEDPK
ncbi:MAG: hypothetical protein L0216_07645 [Planctomycetales bacterium]|nr:hypothetical protein [Planctomycetales bacterium]